MSEDTVEISFEVSKDDLDDARGVMFDQVVDEVGIDELENVIQQTVDQNDTGVEIVKQGVVMVYDSMGEQ